MLVWKFYLPCMLACTEGNGRVGCAEGPLPVCGTQRGDGRWVPVSTVGVGASQASGWLGLREPRRRKRGVRVRLEEVSLVC